MVLIKSLVKAKFEQYMEMTSLKDPAKKNWELWETEKLTGQKKRIMVTFMVGETWKEVCTPKYRRIRMSAFSHTGLAMKVTCSHDHTVSCEGLHENIELATTGTPFDDEQYLSLAWSRHPDFSAAPPPVTPLGKKPALDDDNNDSLASSSGNRFLIGVK